jgi:hypothetical protein
MYGLVAAPGPAGALLDAQGVIGASDEDPGSVNLLEVAFHAEVGVPHREHLRVD